MLLDLFRRERTLYGTGRWATWKEERNLLKKSHKGLCIDGKRAITAELSNHHQLICAPSGGGKSTVNMIGNLLNLTSKSGSAVITDPSAELYIITAVYLRSQGINVQCFNLMDLSDFREINNKYVTKNFPELFQDARKFNPLQRAKTFAEIEEMAETLINTSLSSEQQGSSDGFFNGGAADLINVFTRILSSEKNTPDYEFFLPKNGASLLRLPKLYTADFPQFNNIKNCLLEDDEDTLLTLDAIIGEEQKTLKNILKTAKVALRKFENPEICEVTAIDTLEIENLRSQPTVIFIIVPSGKIENYKFIMSLLYTQIFDYCERNRGGLPIRFLLDETANCGKIPRFDGIVRTLRKYNVSITIVLQNRADLAIVYGEKQSRSILANMKSQIYYNGLELETCEYLSKVLGEATISKSEQGFKKDGSPDLSRSVDTGRKLMTSDEIRCMEKNESIFIHGNQRPIKLKCTPFYENREHLKKMGVRNGMKIMKSFENLQKNRGISPY